MATGMSSRPVPFDCERGDFEFFLGEFELYLLQHSLQDPKDLFISCIGTDAQKVLREIFYPVDPKKKSFDELKTSMGEYCARRKFYGRKQRPGEYTGAYVNELKRLVVKCNFGPFAKDALLDRVARGKLPLESTSSSESNHTSAFVDELSVLMETTTLSPKKFSELEIGVKLDVRMEQQQQQQKRGKDQQKNYYCRFCSYPHPEEKCPYTAATCYKCNKIGHLAPVCPERSSAKKK